MKTEKNKQQERTEKMKNNILKAEKKSKERCFLCTANNYQWIRLKDSLLRRSTEESLILSF